MQDRELSLSMPLAPPEPMAWGRAVVPWSWDCGVLVILSPIIIMSFPDQCVTDICIQNIELELSLYVSYTCL